MLRLDAVRQVDLVHLASEVLESRRHHGRLVDDGSLQLFGSQAEHTADVRSAQIGAIQDRSAEIRDRFASVQFFRFSLVICTS